jgi:O-antigen/teichoic acid export membrane protein
MLSQYWRQVVGVLSGSAVAQAVPVVATLIFAQIVSPAEFGLYAGWLGTVAILGVTLTIRFETVFAAQADGWSRKRVLVAVLITALLLAFLVMLLVFVIFELRKGHTFFGWSAVQFLSIAPAGLVLAISQILQSWFSAEGNYRTLSFFRVLQSTLISVVQLLMIVADLPGALSLGFLTGSMLVVLSFGARIDLPRLSVSRTVVVLCRVWRDQYRCPAFSLPADSLNAAVGQLPVLAVTARFGAELAGYLAMALNLLGAPIALMGKSVLDVFKRHAALAFRLRGECRSEYLHTFAALTIGSILFLLTAYSFSGFLVDEVLGDEWRVTEEVVRVLLPLFVLRFIASPLSYMIYIGAKQHWDLIWQMVLALAVGVSLYFSGDFHQSLFFYMAGYSIMYVVYLIMSYRISCGLF